MQDDLAPRSTALWAAMRYVPMALTSLLLTWTAVVYPYSRYGDWFIYPALIALTLIMLIHILLVALSKPRARQVTYAVVHVGFLIPLWFVCPMLISKDSL